MDYLYFFQIHQKLNVKIVNKDVVLFKAIDQKKITQSLVL